MTETSGTRETIPPYLSRKIRLLSFFTIICVVLIHAYNYHDTYLRPTTALYEGVRLCPVIQFFISNALTRFANPLYFFISGFLFFVGVRRFDRAVYAQKLKKRLVTLMVPYCVWVLAWSAAGVLIVNRCAVSFPVIDEKIGLLREGGLIAFFTTPLPFQFWYIPYRICRTATEFCSSCSARNLAVNRIDFPGREHPAGKNALTFVIPAAWVAACAAYTFFSASETETGLPVIVLLFGYKLCCALGFVSVFILYDAASGYAEKSRLLDMLSSCTFYIHACHEPLQHMIFQRVLEFYNADFVHMAMFFGLPFFSWRPVRLREPLCAGLPRAFMPC